MISKTRHAPSLDEVVFGLGHVKGNVAIICRLCNIHKSDMPLDWFVRVAERIKRVSRT